MTEIRLASWNIRKCIGLDRRRDPHRVARVLSGIDADVVALQEADRRLGQRPAALPPALISAETRFRAIVVPGHDPSLGWHGNALLATDAVEVEEVHGLHLPGFEPRGALVADIRGAGGAAFRIVAVHLGLMRRSRQRQLAAIRADIEARPPRPTVILGDLNEWHPERGLDPFEDWAVHAPGPTFHAARPVAALDRLITTPDIAVEEAAVLNTSLTRVASDHLPLTARLRMIRG